MYKIIKRVTIYGFILIALALIAGSNPAKDIESDFGLPLLYKLRDHYSPLSPPENIFVLTPFKTTQPEEPKNLSDWNRSEHAQIIKKLTKLGVASIPVDLFFKQAHIGEDTELAKSISASNRVVLHQLVNTAESDDSTNMATAYILTNPIKAISSSATYLSPSLLSYTKLRADTFYAYYSVLYESENNECFGFFSDEELTGDSVENIDRKLERTYVATLPVAALEQYLISTGRIQRYLQQALASSQLNKNLQPCQAIAKARKSIADNPEILREIESHSLVNKPISSWLFLLQQLSLASYQNDANPRLRLNLYGPPQTIKTLDYQEFAKQYDSIMQGEENNIFKESIVFVGATNTDSEDSKDQFKTVYTNGEHTMSGTEINATAVANLMQHNYLIRYHRLDSMLKTFLVALTIFVLSSFTRNIVFIVLSGLCLSAYVYFAFTQFTALNYWPPLVLPLCAGVLSMIYAFYRRARAIRKEKREYE